MASKALSGQILAPGESGELFREKGLWVLSYLLQLGAPNTCIRLAGWAFDYYVHRISSEAERRLAGELLRFGNRNVTGLTVLVETLLRPTRKEVPGVRRCGEGVNLHSRGDLEASQWKIKGQTPAPTKKVQDAWLRTVRNPIKLDQSATACCHVESVTC